MKKSTTQAMLFHMGGVPVLTEIPWLMQNGVSQFWYVDGQFGSDSNNGQSPETPFATIGAANTAARATVDWSETPWADRHVIVIAPGSYDENLTTLSHGTIYVGLGWDNRDAQMGVKIKPSTGSPVDVGGIVNTSFWNIGFESADASKAFDSGVVNNCQFINCRFSGAAESVTCASAFYTNDATCSRWINCDFTCAAVGFDIAYVDGGDGFNHNLIEHCRFHQNTTAGLRTSTNLVGPSTLVNDCDFFGGGQTMAIGVDDNSAILELSRCMITATDPVDGCRAANACYGNGSLLSGAGA